MKRVLFALLLLAVVTPLTGENVREANKAIARRIFDEVLTRGDFELASDLYAPDFVNHGRNRDVDLARDQAAARGWLQAFPDLRISPEIVLAERDLVVVLWRATGTNTGEGNGLPATGRRVNTRGITIWRIENGRVKEEWSEFSELALRKQLGLVAGAAIDAGSPPDAAERRIGRATARTVERNRKLVQSVFERIVGEGELSLFGTSYAKEFVNHGIARDGGIQEEIDGTRGFRELAPDLRVRVVKTVAEGDLVAVLYTAEGTNTGAAMGFPATGRHFSIRAMSIMRVDHGKIAEEWSVLDQGQALSQLGMLPGK